MNKNTDVQRRILLVATENAAIKGAKVGGIADVIADLPVALAKQGVIADVAMPGYGDMARRCNGELLHNLVVHFAGQPESVQLYRVAHPHLPDSWVYMFCHPWLDEHIYTRGDPFRPFADDANKFALFNLSVVVALQAEYLSLPDVIHLHDWHTGLVALLRAFDPDYAFLQTIPCVFTIHNLALQGIRPMQDDSSSLQHWYPQLAQRLTNKQRLQISDPRYPDCINPMRCGITLSDRVHLVSPTYAKEVLRPSEPERGFFGGEGLEQDLAAKAKSGLLVGILNGCDYSAEMLSQPANRLEPILTAAEVALLAWQAEREQVSAVDMIALTRVQSWLRDSRCDFLLTSVGRLTDQKVLILRQQLADGRTVLEGILDCLAAYSVYARFVLLGSGDPAIAAQFQQIAARRSNLLFLNGYHDSLPEGIYAFGDLFLMPSSFEPCGISQMLAMRAGQPCLVHGVGGLKDTVKAGVNGFVFDGADLAEQSQNLLAELHRVLNELDSNDWRRIRGQAAATRFEWADIAKQYIRQLYQLN